MSRCWRQQWTVGAGHNQIKPGGGQVRSRNYNPSCGSPTGPSGSWWDWHPHAPPVGSGPVAHAPPANGTVGVVPAVCRCIALPFIATDGWIFTRWPQPWVVYGLLKTSKPSRTSARATRDNARRLYGHLSVLAAIDSGSWPALPRRGETDEHETTRVGSGDDRVRGSSTEEGRLMPSSSQRQLCHTGFEVFWFVIIAILCRAIVAGRFDLGVG